MRSCTGISEPERIDTDGRIVTTCRAEGCPYHHPSDVPPGFPPGYEPVFHAPADGAEHVAQYIIDPGAMGLLSMCRPRYPDGSAVPAHLVISAYVCQACGTGRLYMRNGTPYRREGGRIFLRMNDDPRWSEPNDTPE
jgi:hypothetical protein